MLNYHELTMNEPRDSPARRKQFLVIATIMIVMTLHAGLNAGVLETLAIDGSGTFPGGDFVYKPMMKDYAASTGTLRTVAADLGIAEEGAGNLITEGGVPLDTADLLYSVLLDDESLIIGGKTRFASGALLSGGKAGQDMKNALLEANDDITKEDGSHSKDVKYEVGKLPKVAAAVAQHPFTAGAWSAILQSYKILPHFKEYAKTHGEKGKSPVVIATCSAAQKMCTYYMPLAKRDKFFMGKPITEEYAKEFNNSSWLQQWGIDFGSMDGGLTIGGINLRNVFKGIMKAVGLGGSSAKTSDEL